MRLDIPPLRERRDEIAALVNHFVPRAAQEFGKGLVRLAEETMEHLLRPPWPGNVRQLQNEMRRIVALAEAESVIPPTVLAPEDPEPPSARAAGARWRRPRDSGARQADARPCGGSSAR